MLNPQKTDFQQSRGLYNFPSQRVGYLVHKFIVVTCERPNYYDFCICLLYTSDAADE